jgi:hypothetical protein
MPLYNAQKYLRAALDCLIAQTFEDFELIISDNASTDDTDAIVREYEAADPRIRYIRQEQNKGAAYNFNVVMQEARGEFFMWAAADDLRDPDFVCLAVRVFDADPNCGLVFSDYVVKNLETGECTNEFVGMYNAGPPSKRYLMRLLSPCPSLIYGLHRLSQLKMIPARDYDFFDVHLTHWYAVKSVVKIIPMPLYVAGVKARFLPDGQRVHYPGTAQAPGSGGVRGLSPFNGLWRSLSRATPKRRFDPKRFYADERKMLFDNCSAISASVLYCLLHYFYFRNVRRLNSNIARATSAD